MSWNLEEALAYYRRQGAPADQSALIALLTEVQQETGGSVSHSAVNQIAEAYGIKSSLLLALIRRIPRLRLSGKHTLEICCGPNCSKRRDLAGFVEKTYGAEPKTFTVSHVPCMRLCGKGPNIRWDGTLYHNADENLLKTLIEEAKS